jgi:hypothetical protein
VSDVEDMREVMFIDVERRGLTKLKKRRKERKRYQSGDNRGI